MSNQEKPKQVIDTIINGIDLECNLDTAISILNSYKKEYGCKYNKLFLDVNYDTEYCSLILKGERGESLEEKNLREGMEIRDLSRSYHQAETALKWVKERAAAKGLAFCENGDLIKA